MTGKTEARVREIRSRTRQHRQQHENRVLSFLTVLSLFLLAGVGAVLGSVQTPGIPAIADGYGAVLLRDGAVTYVVIGIAAFVVGVSVTVLCIRLKNRSEKHTDHTEEDENWYPGAAARGHPGGGPEDGSGGHASKNVR